MFDLDINLTKAYFAYTPLLKADWDAEFFVCWYPYNATTGDVGYVLLDLLE